MDRTTQKLASYAASLTWDDLPASTVHEAKRRLIDSIGCAIGGYASEPARIARALAPRRAARPPDASSARATPLHSRAAFANTCAIRYLDCNDTYISIGSGHPSDMIDGRIGADSFDDERIADLKVNEGLWAVDGAEHVADVLAHVRVAR